MGVLQVLFYFVFQIIDYNSFALSITLIIGVLAILVSLFMWRTLRKAV